MARKETVYTVSKKDDTIIRASRTFLAAAQFSESLIHDSFYLCTSEFNDLKKGDPIVEVTSIF